MPYRPPEKHIPIEMLNSNLKNKEIAALLGVGTATISRRRKKLGITSLNKGSPKGARPHLHKGETKNCLTCGKEMYVRPERLESKKYCSRECMLQSEDYLSHRRKKRRPHEKPRLRKATTPAYRSYANKVHRLTRTIYEEKKHIINPNNHPRTLCGVDGGYQLDHITTIRYGFENNISAEEIARVENLRMLSWKENLKRNRKENDLGKNLIS